MHINQAIILPHRVCFQYVSIFSLGHKHMIETVKCIYHYKDRLLCVVGGANDRHGGCGVRTLRGFINIKINIKCSKRGIKCQWG